MSTDRQYTKEIKFDRLTKDFALYLDGEYVGSAPTYHDGERILNELVYHELRSAGEFEVAHVVAITSAPIELARLAVVAAGVDEDDQALLGEVVELRQGAQALLDRQERQLAEVRR